MDNKTHHVLTDFVCVQELLGLFDRGLSIVIDEKLALAGAGKLVPFLCKTGCLFVKSTASTRKYLGVFEAGSGDDRLPDYAAFVKLPGWMPETE